MLITAREAPRKRRGALAQTHRLGSLAPAKARGGPIPLPCFPATWRSGYAAACKAVYTGSIPVVALATARAPPCSAFLAGHGLWRRGQWIPFHGREPS